MVAEVCEACDEPLVVDDASDDGLRHVVCESPTKRDARRLADLTARNQATEGRLRAAGVSFQPEALHGLRAMACERLLDARPDLRPTFDLLYQEVVSEQFAAVEAELRRRQVGIDVAKSGLIIPGR